MGASGQLKRLVLGKLCGYWLTKKQQRCLKSNRLFCAVLGRLSRGFKVESGH